MKKCLLFELQGIMFAISGENLTTRLRELTFRALLRQVREPMQLIFFLFVELRVVD